MFEWGTRLQNGKTLSDYDVFAERTLFMRSTLSGSMRIYVKTTGGKHVEMDVEPSDATYYVKALFSDREGIPADQQRLIFGGRQLEDMRSLCDYHIKNDATVYLVPRLSGC